jgi:hypothetical protein
LLGRPFFPVIFCSFPVTEDEVPCYLVLGKGVRMPGNAVLLAAKAVRQNHFGEFSLYFSLLAGN